ncbi:MAG: adenosylmethionine--8-amino-7-oxononanoate transaminase [Verrucomicrobia bacterium]|nr:MAG: adenosylmethionine--8-amino-7-oxononanoate transaminase [Verrucomicrobiota bacterium]
MNENTDSIISWDKQHTWHPFTQMQAWCAPDHEPLVLVEGQGAILTDSRGRSYLDGNSSIWTNIHGHGHPRIVNAIRQQLDAVAHVSFLGSTNVPAAQLAHQLAALFPEQKLPRTFYSDDGSTAIEVALKMALQFWQLQGEPQRYRIVAFQGAYHGDTAGASSLGGIPLFHERFQRFHFPVERVASLEELVALPAFHQNEVAAIVIEPLIQGAAGMRLWPQGMLAELRNLCDSNGALLILDEILTGFGRTGTLFACEQEHIVPDLLALAKGLTGGYLPLAVTLTTARIFEAFLGKFEEQKTLYYGHSYTGNPVACAAALASLEIFREENVLEKLQTKISFLRELLNDLKSMPHIADIRQCGFIAGIDVRQPSGIPYPWQAQTGARICVAARAYGLLTRPIKDTIVLMPPLCTTEEQLLTAVNAVRQAVLQICGN